MPTLPLNRGSARSFQEVGRVVTRSVLKPTVLKMSRTSW